MAANTVNPALYANCTVATCPTVTSYYNYRISLPANAVFVGFFGLALIWTLGVYAYTRRGLWFTVAMTCGLLSEIIGYAARVLSWQNQWNENPFLAQMICITIGPVFFAAAVYLCLERIVNVYGDANSRIPKKWYTRIFIPCDILSLVLQAIGGILSAVALSDGGSLTLGDNILIAGLSTQVATLVIFTGLCIDFALRLHHRRKTLGDNAATTQDNSLVRVRQSWPFKGFVVSLALSTVLIITRSGYRVAELQDGWTGPVTFNQFLFVGLEPVLMTVAVYALMIFHPSLCLREAMNSKGKRGWINKNTNTTPNNSTVLETEEGKTE